MLVVNCCVVKSQSENKIITQLSISVVPSSLISDRPIHLQQNAPGGSVTDASSTGRSAGDSTVGTGSRTAVAQPLMATMQEFPLDYRCVREAVSTEASVPAPRFYCFPFTVTFL